MRPPARIQSLFSVENMQTWLRAAPDKSGCRGRRAIRLTRADWLPARKAAELLRASSQAVWLGISEYNHQGPEGLERQGAATTP